MSNSNSSVVTSIKQLVAGGVGGVCLILAGHPMDTIKVRIQTMPTPAPGQRPLYKGTLDCVMQTLKKEGFSGFYKGMAAPLIGATPVNSIVFWGYGLGVSLQSGGDPTAVNKLTYSQIAKAGMLSGLCAAFINAPAERIKCLLQIQRSSSRSQYKGFWDCVRQVYQQGGIRSIYRGILSTLARDIPGSAGYFVSYEWLKKNSAQIFNLQNQSAVTLISGGFAGMCYWLISIPADVVKSRIQTAPEGKYKSITSDVIKSLYTKQGFTAFYKGSLPVLLRAFPANAACFFGYEYTMKFLNILIPK